ncbi:MAG: nitroreductase family protein [Acidimicrobiales bacterium]
MELTEAIARRHMTRAFLPDPIEPGRVDELLDSARRAPSAGNVQSTAFLVLEGREQTARYWAVTLPPARRDRFGWPGLLVAPVLVVVWCSPDDYVTRYAEPDKATTGLGSGPAAWATPYWYVDGGMVVQNLLLGAVGAGLGACFFGLFDHEASVRLAFGVPDRWRALGAVALGHAAPDRLGRSSRRGRAPLDEVIHRGRW